MSSRVRLWSVAGVVSGLLIAGCTSTDREPEEAVESGEPSVTQDPVREQSVEEIAAALITAPGDGAPTETSTQPIGSGTATVHSLSGDDGTTQLTIEVMTIERSTQGTRLVLRLSSEEKSNLYGTLGDATGEGTTNDAFLAGLSLDTDDTRYFPLRFSSRPATGDACLCPHIGYPVSRQPHLVTALLPPLPDEVSEVTFRVGTASRPGNRRDGEIQIPDLPVSG